MSLSKFRESLSAKLQPVYVIVDGARPMLDRAIEAVREAAMPKIGPPAFNHSRYRAPESGALDALVTANTLPVMAELRLVEILNLEEASKGFVEALLDYLERPSETTVLLVTGARYPKIEKLNPSVRIAKALKGAGLDGPTKLGETAPIPFVIDRAKSQGKTLGRHEAELLVAAVGSDLGQLEAEVDKLVTFVGQAEAIDAKAVGSATSLTAAAINWDLTTGLAARDVDLTLSTLHRMQVDGDDPRKLLGLVTWQMRQLAQVRQLLLAGVPDREITKQLRMRSDTFRKVRPYLLDGFPDSAELMRRIATSNRHMNSHRAGAERLLEGLVLEMLTGRLRRPPEVPRPR